MGTINIAMELCEKESLIDCLLEMRAELPSSGIATISNDYWKQMCNWALQMVTGMEHLTVKQKLIHGDLAC